MARPQKYHTKEERYKAKIASFKKYRANNPDKVKQWKLNKQKAAQQKADALKEKIFPDVLKLNLFNLSYLDTIRCKRMMKILDSGRDLGKRHWEYLASLVAKAGTDTTNDNIN